MPGSKQQSFLAQTYLLAKWKGPIGWLSVCGLWLPVFILDHDLSLDHVLVSLFFWSAKDSKYYA
jgi:hypothetical protein